MKTLCFSLLLWLQLVVMDTTGTVATDTVDQHTAYRGWVRFSCILLRFSFGDGSRSSVGKARDMNFFSKKVFVPFFWALGTFFWWRLPWISKSWGFLTLACFVTCMQWIRQQHLLIFHRHEIPLSALGEQPFPYTPPLRRECIALFGLSWLRFWSMIELNIWEIVLSVLIVSCV